MQVFFDFGFGEFVFFEVFVYQFFVGFGCSFDYVGMLFFGQVFEFCRNFFFVVGYVFVVIVLVDGFYFDQVDLINEVFFSVDGELDWNWGMIQVFFDLFDDVQEVCVLVVYFVDVDDVWYVVFVGLMLYGF